MTILQDSPLLCKYLYVRKGTYDWNNYFVKRNEKSTPGRETTRARPRPPLAESGEASKVRHDEQTAHSEVDLIESKFVYG